MYIFLVLYLPFARVVPAKAKKKVDKSAAQHLPQSLPFSSCTSSAATFATFGEKPVFLNGKEICPNCWLGRERGK